MKYRLALALCLLVELSLGAESAIQFPRLNFSSKLVVLNSYANVPPSKERLLTETLREIWPDAVKFGVAEYGENYRSADQIGGHDPFIQHRFSVSMDGGFITVLVGPSASSVIGVAQPYMARRSTDYPFDTVVVILPENTTKACAYRFSAAKWAPSSVSQLQIVFDVIETPENLAKLGEHRIDLDTCS